MKIKITAGGIYDGKGVEVPIGSEFTVKNEPTAWRGRYEVISGGEGEGEKVAVVNPTEKPAPVGPFTVKDAGSGWYSLHDAEDAQIGKKLRKDDADGFESLSDEDKAAFAAEHAKD